MNLLIILFHDVFALGIAIASIILSIKSLRISLQRKVLKFFRYMGAVRMYLGQVLGGVPNWELGVGGQVEVFFALSHG